MTHTHRKFNRLRIFVLAGVASLVVGSVGLAASAAADPGSPGLNQASSAVYPADHTNQVLGISGGGNNPGDPGDPGGSAIGDPGGSLAFTGFNAAALLAVGLVLLGLGVGIRRMRLTRPPAQS